ncbi:MAG: AAA family ATPase, partial [Anaerolineales bacterium]
MTAATRSTRLKKLELQGYKTFATRTVFAFAPTITAIVGPNGSGKSNIADSIRWVLGEQAYSLLRGKKTEDMIFAGSESRPRSSMASAVITFDNSDGWLPIEFSEVSVGRRAYRDGQNEYLLNGQRVRLRDVVELLAQSGLAQRTYTIIGQGLVDAALSLRADERRALFEEAAGIGLYRTRREEALRRLEATEHNLERVQDILAELRPRLRALERQAKRAQDYEVVRLELHAALLQWYGHHWHRSQRLVANARREAGAKVAARDDLRGRQAQAMEQLARRRAEITRVRAQLHGWIEPSTALNVEREDLRRKLAVDGERLRWLEEQAASIAEELKSLETAWAETNARLERARAEAQPEEEALHEAEARAESRASGAGGSAAPIDDPLESAVAREAAWKARLEAAHLAHDSAARRLETVQAELRIRAEELEKAEQSWAESQKRLEGVQAAARQASAALERTREELRKARAEADRAHAERARLVEKQ